MVPFNEDRITVKEGRVEDRGREKQQGKLVIAGTGYRYYTYFLTSY